MYKPRHRLRIAMVAPPFLPVPPPRYGGTERIVAALADGLYRRGHDVTLFASGDSTVSARVVPIVPRALWSEAVQPSQEEAMASVVDFVENYGEDFDIFHSHLEWHGFAWARRSAVPVVSTLHGRIDIGRTADVIAEYRDIPLIAISERQRSFAPDQNWVATIHHGLPLESVPAGRGSGGYLLFVGRLTPEKGIDAAIELARRANLPLIVAAKALEPHEVETYERLVRPAEEDGALRFLGEVGQPARDKLLGDALATVMLGDWPEPFGLVAVESMATGTPVLARRAGALPEIVRDGVDGFVVDSVEDAERAVAEITALDRAVIRADALRRFSAERMVDDYERVLTAVAGGVEPQTDVLAGREPEGRTPLGVP